MSHISTHELDLQIQLSLVAKIRQAAQRYKSEPVEPGSAALLAYVVALEGLADHIDTRCRGSQLGREIELRAQRPRQHSVSDQRVLQFPAEKGAGTAA
jgi:hypothetical protein